jgi:hypothetical protein
LLYSPSKVLPEHMRIGEIEQNERFPQEALGILEYKGNRIIRNKFVLRYRVLDELTDECDSFLETEPVHIQN